MNRQFLSPKQLSERYGEESPSEYTLKRWRLEGKGPKFVKLGQKVAYPLDKLLEWEDAGGEECCA
jgi:hypothetical protein